MPGNHPSRMPGLTSSVTGPDDGVASPMLFGGNPLPNLLDLNSVARPGARGVRQANRRNTMRMPSAVLLLLTGSLFQTPIATCTCSPRSALPAIERVGDYDCVCVGTVTARRQVDRFTGEATVSVQEGWVGPPLSVLRFLDCVCGAACCRTLFKGKTYLIFARKNGNYYSTTLCDPTTEAESAGTIIKALGPPVYHF